MKLIVARDYDKMSQMASNIICAQVLLKPDLVLGLATGSTPIGTYQEMVKLYNNQLVDFSLIRTFNLDEYIGLADDDPCSYHAFMQEQLFSQINIPAENIFLPPGNGQDAKKACQDYDAEIAREGGIDLQLLGIGSNGHIGFNEPAGNFEEKTHVVSLKEQTIQDNARFFSDVSQVPKQAISMGIKTIMSARRIVMLISGKQKASVLRDMYEGPITPKLPASVLRLHSQATVVVDREAASLLQENELITFI